MPKPDIFANDLIFFWIYMRVWRAPMFRWQFGEPRPRSEKDLRPEVVQTPFVWDKVRASKADTHSRSHFSGKQTHRLFICLPVHSGEDSCQIELAQGRQSDAVLVLWGPQLNALGSIGPDGRWFGARLWLGMPSAGGTAEKETKGTQSTEAMLLGLLLLSHAQLAPERKSFGMSMCVCACDQAHTSRPPNFLPKFQVGQGATGPKNRTETGDGPRRKRSKLSVGGVPGPLAIALLGLHGGQPHARRPASRCSGSRLGGGLLLELFGVGMKGKPTAVHPF